MNITSNSRSLNSLNVEDLFVNKSSELFEEACYDFKVLSLSTFLKKYQKEINWETVSLVTNLTVEIIKMFKTNLSPYINNLLGARYRMIYYAYKNDAQKLNLDKKDLLPKRYFVTAYERPNKDIIDIFKDDKSALKNISWGILFIDAMKIFNYSIDYCKKEFNQYFVTDEITSFESWLIFNSLEDNLLQMSSFYEYVKKMNKNKSQPSLDISNCNAKKLYKIIKKESFSTLEYIVCYSKYHSETFLKELILKNIKYFKDIIYKLYIRGIMKKQYTNNKTVATIFKEVLTDSIIESLPELVISIR